MTSSCHQLLTGTGFALNQQRSFQAGHLTETRLQRFELLRFAKERLHAFSMIVVQRSKTFANTARRVERE
ncbi:hypothetical protein D9M69_591610 [compost metagenome]